VKADQVLKPIHVGDMKSGPSFFDPLSFDMEIGPSS